MTPALVVGEGVAGVATALALVELDVAVTLIARVPAEHTESTSRHDGLDAALGDDDDPVRHLEDAVALAGEAARPFLQGLTEAAPALADELARLDVPFARTRSGELSCAKLAGSSRARTLHAGCRTAHHVSRRLSALARRREAEGKLERLVGWSVLDLVLDDAGLARGVVARSFASGEHRGFAADGICLASGGHTGLFFDDTLAPPSLGGLTGLALARGAKVIAPERVSQHPLCYRAGGFVRRLPRQLLALGAGVEAGLLDLTELDRAPLRAMAGPALEAYARSTGADAYSEPVAVESAPDRTLGGLEIGLDHATSIPGLYAVGGAVGAYFGAATSPGVALGAALHGARVAATSIAERRGAVGEWKLDRALRKAVEKSERWLDKEGGETVEELRAALVRRELDEIEARLEQARLSDRSAVANASLELAWELEQVLGLARLAAAAEAP